jgi:hypothetical protein
MPGLKFTTRCALALAGVAIPLGLAPAVGATPDGPCAEVPSVGVCIPFSEQPSPPQQSQGESAFIPDATSSIHVVN